MQEQILKKEEPDCMSLEGFATCIKLDIQKQLGTGFSVRLKDVTKNNGTVLKGLLISENAHSSITPAFYLDDSYELYKKGMAGLPAIEKRILECWQNNRLKIGIDVQGFLDWKEARDKVIYKLVNFERNKKFLEDVPYHKFLDLAVIPALLAGAMDGGIGTATVHKPFLGLWGITEEELFGFAKANTLKFFPSEIKNMGSIMGDLLGEDNGITTEMRDTDLQMYVLSNKPMINGASCLLYPNVVSNFAKRMRADLYILPSSIHELILIPKVEGGSMPSELEEIVKAVNAKEVRPDEFLSDSVYVYSRETDSLSVSGKTQRAVLFY